MKRDDDELLMMEKDRREVPVIEPQLQRLPLQELFEEERQKTEWNERDRQTKKKRSKQIGLEKTEKERKGRQRRREKEDEPWLAEAE